MKKLYVGNLSFQTTEDDLRTLFEQAGELSSVALITDRDSGQSRGFAFIEFANDAEAQAAIQRFDGMEIEGRALKVNVAKARTDTRERTTSRPGGRRNRF